MGPWEFPGSPVVTSTAGDTGSIPSQGSRPQVARQAPPTSPSPAKKKNLPQSLGHHHDFSLYRNHNKK